MNVRKRTILTSLAGVIVSLVGLWWYRWQPRPYGSTVLSVEEDTSFAKFKPVDIPVGLLVDYYEHVNEHVPPRDPTGAMQRRERGYRAPRDPSEMLGKKNVIPTNVPSFGSMMAKLESDLLSGHDYESDRVGRDDLRWMLQESSLSPEDTLEFGRGVQFLLGPKSAAVCFDVGLDRAMLGIVQNTVVENSPNLVEELDQTKVLWQVRDYVGLEKRFRVVQHMYLPLTVENRRAAVLCASAVFLQGRFDEAVELLSEAQAAHNRAGDLGVLEKSDIAEMEYLQGSFLFSARKYNLAVEHFEAFLRSGDARAVEAARMMEICLRRIGREDRAREIRERFGLGAVRSG